MAYFGGLSQSEIAARLGSPWARLRPGPGWLSKNFGKNCGRMTMNKLPMSFPPEHPEDLLEAFALGTLEEWERDEVEAHLDVCPDCSSLLAGFEEPLLLLAGVAPQEEPPTGLRSRVMEAVDDLPAVFVPQDSKKPHPLQRPNLHFVLLSAVLRCLLPQRWSLAC